MIYAGGTAGIQPYQFRPETYGAKGNGQVAGDVTTNATSVVTSPTIGALGQSAVGMYIMIHGANGPLSGPYIGTITAVSGNNITVSGTAPTASVSNCPAVFGTDDTAAINSAVSAASTYAQANTYFAEVLFAAKIYILGMGPTQIGNGTTTPTFNTQVQIPYPNANGTTQKLILALTGAGDAGYLQYWQSLVPNVTGTALVSMLNPTSAAANNATFGHQSVVGGPSGSAGFTGAFANVKVVAKGIGVWTAIWHNLICWDLGYVSAARTVQCGATAFAPTGVNGSSVQPYLNNLTAVGLTGAISVGWRYPVGQNNLDIWADDVMAEGHEIGFMTFDHFAAGRMNSIYCDVVLKWDSSLGTSGTQHGIFIQSMAAEAYNGGFRTNGGAAQCFINWDCENSGVPAYDINDGANGLWGWFYFGDKIDNRAPSVTGASNLTVLSANSAPGHMASPPAVPLTTVIATLVYRPATVVVHTGAGVTVSAITVDGTATSQTVAAASSSVPIRVPSGKSIALTYAGGTPTWDWWLD